ncbi:MAG: hypothetical protein LBB38_01330 [Puniceicoccales bacterium]|jgi:hypothetical protein|nr:hypothetical protein [Puniceicoccales bacterium]
MYCGSQIQPALSLHRCAAAFGLEAGSFVKLAVSQNGQGHACIGIVPPSEFDQCTIIKTQLSYIERQSYIEHLQCIAVEGGIDALGAHMRETGKGPYFNGQYPLFSLESDAAILADLYGWLLEWTPTSGAAATARKDEISFIVTPATNELTVFPDTPFSRYLVRIGEYIDAHRCTVKVTNPFCSVPELIYAPAVADFPELADDAEPDSFLS